MACVVLDKLVLGQDCQGLALLSDLCIPFYRLRFLIMICNDKKIIVEIVSSEEQVKCSEDFYVQEGIMPVSIYKEIRQTEV